MKALLLVTLLAGCWSDLSGNLDQSCNKDGTCNYPQLECRLRHEYLPSEGHMCVIK